jgi:hypothetical protein
MAQSVRLVTPSVSNSPSVQAFYTELVTVKGWAGSFTVYPANNDMNNLQTQVKLALQNPMPDLFVAAGTQAATLLQNGTTQVTIIQAAGSKIPDNAQNNMTGFYLNGLTVAQYHWDHLPGPDITILWDDTNPPSSDIRNGLSLNGKVPHDLKISSPGGLNNEDGTKFKKGFMLIPNAMYFDCVTQVAQMVERHGVVNKIYYPEVQFKNAHSPGWQAKCTVKGHDIPGTFVEAADLAYDILSGKYTGKPLPGFSEAIIQ